MSHNRIEHHFIFEGWGAGSGNSWEQIIWVGRTIVPIGTNALMLGVGGFRVLPDGSLEISSKGSFHRSSSGSSSLTAIVPARFKEYSFHWRRPFLGLLFLLSCGIDGGDCEGNRTVRVGKGEVWTTGVMVSSEHIEYCGQWQTFT